MSALKKTKKPRVVSEWSHNDVFKLIACVQKQRALWDAQHKRYRNKHERTKLWNEMSESDFKSKYAGTELLAKWSNIRIQFKSYSNRKQMNNDEASATVKWKYFSAMQFLKQPGDEQAIKTETHWAMSESSHDTLLVSSTPQLTLTSQPSLNAHTQRSSISTSPTAESTSNEADNMQPNLDPLIQMGPRECEFEIFGKFLASELRSLDNIPKARRIKHKLNRFFLDELEKEIGQ